MILEGAKQLDAAKTDLQLAEQKEGKIKKELKKAAKKATAEELREMTSRLEEAEREKDLAQLEVVDRVREHEAVKMIRIKDGVSKVSEAYVDYAQKCEVLFSAQKEIALQIPDVQDKDIQDIKYTGQICEIQISRLNEYYSRSRLHYASCCQSKRQNKEVSSSRVFHVGGQAWLRGGSAPSVLRESSFQSFLQRSGPHSHQHELPPRPGPERVVHPVRPSVSSLSCPTSHSALQSSPLTRRQQPASLRHRHQEGAVRQERELPLRHRDGAGRHPHGQPEAPGAAQTPLILSQGGET